MLVLKTNPFVICMPYLLTNIRVLSIDTIYYLHSLLKICGFFVASRLVVLIFGGGSDQSAVTFGVFVLERGVLWDGAFVEAIVPLFLFYFLAEVVFEHAWEHFDKIIMKVTKIVCGSHNHNNNNIN